MRYFIDMEFIEGFHKPLFGKRRHFIDLISIAICADDGREYEAISSEYNFHDASEWVKDNVIFPLYTSTVHGFQKNVDHMHDFHKHYGKTNKEIAQDIVNFINPICGPTYHPLPVGPDYEKKHNTKQFGDAAGGFYLRAQPEIYGYYSDYDWVLFCSLFGTMMDLPEGFPMYAIDLKQMLDGKAKYLARTCNEKWPHLQATQEKALKDLQNDPAYPLQKGEHLAIWDARWNKKLYEFLTK